MKIISRDLNPPESSAGGCFPLLMAALVPIGRSTDARDAKSYAVLSLPPFPFSFNRQSFHSLSLFSWLCACSASCDSWPEIRVFCPLAFLLLSLLHATLVAPPGLVSDTLASSTRYNGRLPSESAHPDPGPAFWRPPMAHLRQGL